MKKHLFSPAGRDALAVLLRRRPLLAFDFDGTLAPIVPQPRDARIPRAVASQLARLARRLPVAIVSGRAVGDLRGRLGFEPSFVFGSHGAEDAADAPAAEALARRLDPLRSRIEAHGGAIGSAGVFVEDKGASVALHYRLAPDRERARAAIDALRLTDDPELRVFSGKMVENVVAAGAPDKAAAVRSLLERCECDSAFFAGDDVNDEPVFVAAPPHWLTVRIGRDDPHSSARYFLDSPAEMAVALQTMIDELDDTHRA
jgi:trehalose 6-phosphate phosphatase